MKYYVNEIYVSEICIFFDYHPTPFEDELAVMSLDLTSSYVRVFFLIVVN